MKYSLLLFGILSTVLEETNDLTQYVNPLIGTVGSNTGTVVGSADVFPGPSLPFGVVKLGPDTTEFDPTADAFAGYTPDGNVTAFTLFHECGIGGAPKYGVVPQMPLTTLDNVNILDNLTYMQPRAEPDFASVGYYRSKLQNGIEVELSASRHAGILQYTFTASDDKIILVDISHHLPSNSEAEPLKSQSYSNGQLVVVNNGAQYTGWGVWKGGWNGGTDYKIYFCAEFNPTPQGFQTFAGPWINSGPDPSTPVWLYNGTAVQGAPEGDDMSNRVGAYFFFNESAEIVQSRTGVSFISTEKACQFVQQEIPSWNLNDTVEAAVNEWNKDVLSNIKIPGSTNKTLLTMFYTGLYHAHLLPSDRTGENPKWNSTEPYYDDFYTLWDIFRCLNSFYLLVQRSRAVGMIRSLIDTWRHEGYMPDARSGNYNGKTQGGSNADNVLADAYVKGVTDGINWADGYAAMKKDAEVTPGNYHDPEDPTLGTKEGRGALPDWLDYGYITPNYSSSVSRTVEYSLNDFSLSQVAKTLVPADYEKYLNRSRNWKNLWNPSISAQNFSGFMAPKNADGSWVSGYSAQNNSFTTEGLPWDKTKMLPDKFPMI